MRKGRGNAAGITIVLVAAVIIGYALTGNNKGQSGNAADASAPGAVLPAQTESAAAATPTVSPTPAATPEPKNSEPSETEYVPTDVTLYLPNANADGFTTKAAVTDGSAENIVELLVENGALVEGSAVLSFSQDEAAIDMNAAFGRQLGNGTTGEYFCAGALVNTFLTYYGMDGIMLTVEGKLPENAHGVYDEPLGFYE